MRYAVPVSNGIVAAHFGHCQHFAMFDVDSNGKITERRLVDSPDHQPGLLPAWLAEEGVSAVIAGGMGSRAQDLFNQNNIQVVIGATEIDPEAAVLQFIEGSLATTDNICDH